MKLRSVILAAFLFLTLPLASSFAQVGISINFAPPPLPVMVQPPAPVEGYIWTPGYWGWGGADYYWVPGVWVPPPTIGLLWTPPWWGWNNGAYVFNEGYWGPTVGFYGGINYGFGYFDGYWGGRWEGDRFLYNTAVTHVNTTVIHNTYVDKTVVNKQVNANRASFNGPNGVRAQATAEQKAAAENARKAPPTSEQLARRDAAIKDPKLQASVNKGHPSQDAIKSFNQQHGTGAQGAGGAATGAGAGKAENKTGTASENAGFGAGAANAGEHANKHATENFHGNKQNLGETYGKAHTSKATGYTGAAHTQHGMMQGPPRHPQNQMGSYHAQGGGSNRGQPQQGKKKPNQGPPH